MKRGLEICKEVALKTYSLQISVKFTNDVFLVPTLTT